jgi:hypothetical protein
MNYGAIISIVFFLLLISGYGFWYWYINRNDDTDDISTEGEGEGEKDQKTEKKVKENNDAREEIVKRKRENIERMAQATRDAEIKEQQKEANVMAKATKAAQDLAIAVMKDKANHSGDDVNSKYAAAYMASANNYGTRKEKKTIQLY